MSIATLYPPAPLNVPADFTKASGRYRLRLFVLVLSLGAFLMLYLAMVAGSAFLTYTIATHPLGKKGEFSFMLNGLGTLAAGMLCLFLLKGLFKGRRADRSMYVQLKRSEQADLFAFIDRLCVDVGAPKPARVYVSPDVNAAVVYDTSLLNLVIPPKKHLLIGLGLVNSVNLSEFKATLAHEFGHFSQNSLSLGRYVYIVNRVLRDIVYGRDSWDDFINWWCRIDLRLSFPAWGLKGLVWALRGVLDRTFRAIALLDLALSRQMEFNADDVAVSVAGSDAIVNVLCRLDFANEALGAAARDLHAAADHELFTHDLFFHQIAAAEWLRKQRKDPKLGLPPESTGDPDAAPIFDPAKGGGGAPDMWSTHPANYERERNAKRHYLPAPIDSRSPWLLFNHLDDLKLEVTRRFYLHGMERRQPYRPIDPIEVQKFIDSEHAETTYDAKYQGLFDDRFLQPGDLPAVVPQVDDECTENRIGDFLRQWPSADLAARMKQHVERRGEMQVLEGLKSGNLILKGRTFTFREIDRTQRDVGMLHKLVEKELDDDYAEFAALDRRVFLAHLDAARLLHNRRPADAAAEELLRRYQFHVATQELLRKLIADDNRMKAVLHHLSGRRQLEANEFQEVVGILREIADSLAECVAQASRLRSPALTNVPEGTSLRQLIWEKDTDLPRMRSQVTQIKSEWIADYMRKQTAAQNRLRRIHFKSLGNILALQERITRDWLTATHKSVRNDCADAESER